MIIGVKELEILELTEEPTAFIRTLERYIQSGHLNFLVGSGASRPAIGLAGDVEAQIDVQLALGDFDEANKIALDFIEELENQHRFLPNNYMPGTPTDTTLSAYVEFLSSVDRILFERKNILLPRQANVFTTNYDEFFENAASKLPTMVLNDGFNRRVGVAEFEYSPEVLFDRVYRSGTVYDNQSEVPAVNLIKLHGSLSWKRNARDHIVFDASRIPPLTAAEKGTPANIAASLAKRAVILPNMRKFESTLLDRVYFDLLRLYSNAMERENSLLLVFGFSFADEHILEITRRALRNPTSKVIIFCYSEGDATSFEHKFNAHRNVVVVKPQAGDVIDFAKLNSVFSAIGSKSEFFSD